MIERIGDLPGNVLGLSAHGKVTGEDYEKVIVPAIEEKLKEHDKLRLLYHLGADYDGFAAAAAWEDAKVGMKHITHFDKVAVVTDVDWIRHTAKAFGFVMPCHVQVFKNDELDQAKTWIAGD